jgi:NAD+ synthase (glutamine-hydrolysing)
VETVVATGDLDDVASLRGAYTSMRQQAAAAPRIPFLDVDFRLCGPSPAGPHRAADVPRPVRYHVPEEEIAMGPACWLWDYLRRSGAAGYLLPLSGGADSSSTAALVGSMCQLAVKAAATDAGVAADVRRLAGAAGGDGALPDAAALASKVLSTIYMGTENSGDATRRRAAALAGEIGAAHLSFDIDTVVAALLALFVAVTRRTPRFKVDGGSVAENLALQNIQARLRMVVAFLFAQLLPWVRGGPGGFLLVLMGWAVVGIAAIWLVNDPRASWQRWACILGLIGQPFWFYASWQANQWGIFLLSIAYALAWLRGARGRTGRCYRRCRRRPPRRSCLISSRCSQWS